MKKITSFLLAIYVCGCITACGGVGLSNNSNESNLTENPSVSSQTSTPEPTTEPEPVIIPNPVIYTGSGDDVIEITPPDGAYVFHISGNSEGHHFAVKSYDANGKYLTLLVNTTEPYEGKTLEPSLSTSLLEISAVGDWTIELLPTYYLQEYTSGDTIQGSGDDIFLTSNIGKTAQISGNSDSHHFAVKAYGPSSNDLLVNTTDPYEGKVLIKCNPFLFVVTSESTWTITLQQ